MGIGRSVLQPPTGSQTSTGSWGIGGSVLTGHIYGARPRSVRYVDGDRAVIEKMLSEAVNCQQPLEVNLRQSLLNGAVAARADSMRVLGTALRDEACVFLGSNMDAIVERELFLADCAPYLKTLLPRFGVNLLVCESRWDRDLELLNGHDGNRVRQSELSRAISRSCCTAVILILGDKLGPAPLPSSVDCTMFGAILSELDEMGRGSELLRSWYVQDNRTRPSLYRLRAIQSVQSDFLNLNGRKQQEDAVLKWEREGRNPMLADLRAAVESLSKKGRLATELAKRMLGADLVSISNAAISADCQECGSMASRSIIVNRGFEAVRGRLGQDAAEYVDIEYETRDASAAIELERLKLNLKDKMPSDQVFDFSIPWETAGLNPQSPKHSQYLAAFGDKVTSTCVKICAEQLKRKPDMSDLELEVVHHLTLLVLRARTISGRDEERSTLDKFLAVNPVVPSAPTIAPHTLILSGPEGVGKTSVLAAAVLACIHQEDQASDEQHADSSQPAAEPNTPPETIWVVRFCGTTHDSRTAKALMTSICDQVSSALGIHNPAILHASNLPYAFAKLLSHASAQKRIVLVLDGIDKIEGEHKRPLHWLPMDSLPSHVTLIMTASQEFVEGHAAAPGLAQSGSQKTVRINTATSQERSLQGTLATRLPDSQSWVELRAFRPEETTAIIRGWLDRDSRVLPDDGIAALQSAAAASVDAGCGLLLTLLYWLSSDAKGLRSSETGNVIYPMSTEAVVAEVLRRLERRHGMALMTLVVGGLAAARDGLSRAEIEDLCAINDAVLQHSFRWAISPLARVNPHHVSLLLESLALLTEERRGGLGRSVIALRHDRVRRLCAGRYLGKAGSPGGRFEPLRVRDDLAVLFSGAASGRYHPLVLAGGGAGAQQGSWGELVLNSDRQLPPNPDVLRKGRPGTAPLYNDRKLTELPHQLLQLGRWEPLVELLTRHESFEFLSGGARMEQLGEFCQTVIDAAGPDLLVKNLERMLKPENLPNAQARGAAARRAGRLLWGELSMQAEAMELLGQAREAHKLMPEGTEREAEEAETQWVLGEMSQLAGDWDGATQYLDMAWRLRRGALGRGHAETVMAGWAASAAEGKCKRHDTAVQRLREVLRDQRWDVNTHEEDVAETMARLADLELQAGRTEEAMEMQENAVRVRKVVLGVEHLDVGNSVLGLGMAHDRMGQTAEALARFGEALQIKRARLGWKNLEVASLLNNIGVAHERLAQLDKAVLRYEQALRIFRARLGQDEATVATIANNLGNVYKSVGQTKRALACYSDARRIRELYKESSPMALAETLNNLAGVLLMEGQTPEAEACCEQSLAIRKAVLKDEQTIEVATAQHNLATVLIAKGVHDERVETLCTSALNTKMSKLGPENLEVAEVLIAVSSLAQAQGRGKDAIAHGQRVLTILKHRLGNRHPLMAQQHMTMAVLHKANSELVEALSHAKDALAARLNPPKTANRRDMRPDGGWWLWGAGEGGDVAVAASLELVGELYGLRGKLQRAFDCAHRALVFRRKLAAPSPLEAGTASPRTRTAADGTQSGRWQAREAATPVAPKRAAPDPSRVEARRQLATSLLRIGKLARRIDRGQEGLGWLQESLDIRREVDGPGAESVGESLHELGLQLWNLDRGGRAVETLEEALAVRRGAGAESAGLADTLSALAAGLWNQGRGAEALDRGRESVRVREKVLGEGHVKLADALSNMADLLRSQGELKEALECAQRALLIFQQRAKGGGEEVWQGSRTRLGAPTKEEAAGEVSSSGEQQLDGAEAGSLLESPRRQARQAALEDLLQDAETADETKLAASSTEATRRSMRQAGDSDDVAEALAQVAMLWRELGEEANARELLEESAQILERLYGPEHAIVQRAVVLIQG